MRCLLVADDLTGACDAAIPFQSRGGTVLAHLDYSNRLDPDYYLNAFSTESRNPELEEIDRRLRVVASHLGSDRSSIVFKKIDSTLRGNPGAEIRIALKEFGCDHAIITPAFPEMARVVRDGHLHVLGAASWEPMHVASHLIRQGLESCTHVPANSVGDALSRREPFISLDAACDEDLDRIVSEALGSQRRILWAGSAGLASALARAVLPNSTQSPARPATDHRPVLFCIGSDHPVTLDQLSTLKAHYSLAELHVDSEFAGPLKLAAGSHVLLLISRNHTEPERLASILLKVRPQVSAMLLCGGDTAALVCRSVKARALELRGEIVTGLPWSLIQEGLLNGLPVATKSGGFGAQDALINVARFFACPNKQTI